jgi:hypothetical protein
MAYQLSDIVSKVQQRVRDTNYSAAEIKNYINDTQNDVFNEFRLPFMEAVQTYTVTAADSDITHAAGLPDDYVQALDLIYTGTGGERVISFLDIREIERMYADPDDTTSHPAGSPLYWYYYANTIRVFPAPSSAYTLRLRYYKKPTLLTDDTDVPEIPSEFEELLVRGASSRVLEVKDNYDQAAVHENKYTEQLQKLVNKYAGQSQVGSPVTMRINKYAIGKTSF